MERITSCRFFSGYRRNQASGRRRPDAGERPANGATLGGCQERPDGLDTMTATYTAGMSLGITYGVEVLSESWLGELTHEWLKSHWPFGESGAAQSLVSGVAVGDRKELDGMAGFGKLGGGAAELDVAVVRVCADGDNAQLRRLREGECGEEREQRRCV